MWLFSGERVVGEPAQRDLGDGLAVDTLGDRQPQRRIGQDRSWAPLNVK